MREPSLLKALSDLAGTVLRITIKLIVIFVGAFVALVAALTWKK